MYLKSSLSYFLNLCPMLCISESQYRPISLKLRSLIARLSLFAFPKQLKKGFETNSGGKNQLYTKILDNISESACSDVKCTLAQFTFTFARFFKEWLTNPLRKISISNVLNLLTLLRIQSLSSGSIQSLKNRQQTLTTPSSVLISTLPCYFGFLVMSCKGEIMSQLIFQLIAASKQFLAYSSRPGCTEYLNRQTISCPISSLNLAFYFSLFTYIISASPRSIGNQLYEYVLDSVGSISIIHPARSLYSGEGLVITQFIQDMRVIFFNQKLVTLNQHRIIIQGIVTN